jgi:hypothetical protein
MTETIQTETYELLLSRAGGFRSVAIKPPLTDEQLRKVPRPHIREGNRFEDMPLKIQKFDNGSMALSYADEEYGVEKELDYATRLAKHLGGTVLDATVFTLHPIGLFEDM